MNNKRFLCLFLALLMLTFYIPPNVYAADVTQETQELNSSDTKVGGGEIQFIKDSDGDKIKDNVATDPLKTNKTPDVSVITTIVSIKPLAVEVVGIAKKLINGTITDLFTDLKNSDDDIIDIESVRELLKTEPNTAFFWSGTTDGIGGQDRALEIAKKHDGVTLAFVIETNKIDMPDWDFNNPKWVEAWEQVSAAYAEQASGEIHAVIGTKLREGSMWETTELPRLKANPDVTKITIIDPKTEEEKIIFER